MVFIAFWAACLPWDVSVPPMEGLAAASLPNVLVMHFIELEGGDTNSCVCVHLLSHLPPLPSFPLSLPASLLFPLFPPLPPSLPPSLSLSPIPLFPTPLPLFQSSSLPPSSHFPPSSIPPPSLSLSHFPPPSLPPSLLPSPPGLQLQWVG